MLASGPLLCSLLIALQVTAVTAGGDGGPKTRIRGIDFAGKGCIGASALSSSGRHPGNWYGYDETAADPSRQYNGRVYDPSTGFHDYGARLYWPEIGRFISADTYGGSPANPASLNRYAYVQNNPYKYVDPSGRDPVESRIFEKPISYSYLERAGLADKVSTEYIVNHGLDREAAASVGVSLQGMTQSEQNLLAVESAGVGAYMLLAGVALSTVDPYAGTTSRQTLKPDGGGTTKEVIERKAPGRDGGRSQHIIEKQDGQTISKTHQVTKDGEVVHQHQEHIGKYGGTRRFPDEWTGTKTINASDKE